MVGIQSLMNEDLFDALNSEECYINTQVRRRGRVVSKGQ
jgi:hypothetical protein